MKKGIMMAVLMAVSILSIAQDIRQQFQTPPFEARPRVWWHWMNGNITKDGIFKDLMWMHRVGIGGFQNFDAGLATPQIVDKRLVYMDPEWKDAFAYAAQLADSLDLEMAIASAPGWSETGGPWVQSKDGMKKLVWRELRVKGGKTFDGKLPEPYSTTGLFQNIPLPSEMGGFSLLARATEEKYYSDIAVIAFRVPEKDVSMLELNPKVTSSGGHFTLEQLTDGDLAKTELLPSDKKEGSSWIQFEFNKPQTFKAISMSDDNLHDEYGVSGQPYNKLIETSDDGIHFKEIAKLQQGKAPLHTVSIPVTTARFFRIRYKNPEVLTPTADFGPQLITAEATKIAELVLHTTDRVNHAEEKVGFAASGELEKYPTPNASEVLNSADVMDLTAQMNSDGHLNWKVPEGEWEIIRFGYSLTGKKNHPASPEATGLEVDKMDASAVRNYFIHYINMYKKAACGLLGNRGIQYLLNDSYEAGQGTWTPLMIQEFEKRRGYKLLPWMPVLTGKIVNSAEDSERFLWDWRKTIGELIVENHYDQLTDILKEYGMKGRYTESHENGRVYLTDGMEVKRSAAIPMSAQWVTNTSIPSDGGGIQADIRESASVAHVYGQNLVAAESLTTVGMGNTAWSYHPGNLKSSVDNEMANGLNRFVIHTSPHQPVDDKIPGLGLYAFGQWFDRHDTWAEQAKTWTDYLSRSCYMLQQGKFVADVAYYYGEDNNITSLFSGKTLGIPEGYEFDFINADALIRLLTVKDGRLITPSGMCYRMLVLDKNARRMSLSVLRKIAKLVEQGALICGTKPEICASLNDDKVEFQRLVDEIWNSGRKNVYQRTSIEEVLNSIGATPDFSYDHACSAHLRYVHRRLIDGEIYWVNNPGKDYLTMSISFRVVGKRPQVWHPETGRIEDVSYSIAGGRTQIILHLVPNDAVFVVFRETAAQTKVQLNENTDIPIMEIKGPWQVSFQEKRGAPANAVLNSLMSYTESTELGIKYFSGTAIYKKTIRLTKKQLKGAARLILDLGNVGNLAEVIVNGKSVGIVWKEPFQADITEAVVIGENTLMIKVTNTWTNRLIGDAQPDVKEKITYTTMPFYRFDAPLQPAGLLGPVWIVKRDGK